jgi:iron complex transport system permease protein
MAAPDVTVTVTPGGLTATARDRVRSRRWLALGCLGGALGLALAAALAFGAVKLGPGDLWFGLTGRGDRLEPVERTVLWSLRLPRAAAAVLVGATLAVCGAAVQGLFRNPLADPGLIGVTGGAAFGSVLYLKLAAGALAGVSAFLGQLALPACALAGGLAATLAMQRIAGDGGRTALGLLLLAGLALNTLTGAAVGFVLFFADDEQLRQFVFWTMGSLGHATWERLAAAAPFFLVALWWLPQQAAALNALLLGEAEAGHLGVDLPRIKRFVVLGAAAGAGAAVAVAGGIGFIGLVVPHLVRQTLGPDHRWLLPASALAGATLLLLADLAARTLAAPAELPVGVLTATLGAPVFFALLRARRHATWF